MSAHLAERVVVGVDGCKGGWIAVSRTGGDSVDCRVHPSFESLIAFHPANTVIAVDMPIGLPDRIGRAGRGPEVLVRKHLGARQSSVFASDPPRGVSIQAFALFSKIREIDVLLRARPELRFRVIESHPEAAFWRLNGERAMVLPKKVKGQVYPAGMVERRSLLGAQGLDAAFLHERCPAGAGEDDFLDACAMLLVAERRASGLAQPFPDPPLEDGHGIPIAIWT